MHFSFLVKSSLIKILKVTLNMCNLRRLEKWY
uniref:Uncharacterized protein n=1 Tax=Anguilla anguilla TaxID=7936 RepID=A0A0E9SE37_ANGAN